MSTAAFPVADLLPKRETGATEFLSSHPEFDGRGVVIAVLDTGVDPGAAGLQVTSDGKPKMLDVVDCTGCGDVKMGEFVSVGADRTVVGLSGRRLRLNDEWNVEGDRVRLGLKLASDIMPRGLVKDWATERKKKWTAAHDEALARAREAATVAEESKASNAAELRARATELEAEKAADPGAVFDVVAFQDGGRWRAAVDGSQTGDMGSRPALTNFRAERQFDVLDSTLQLNYAVNVYGDGSVVNLVTDSGSHGTHVACIAAAHHPDRPEQDGVAPGAQVVSFKIGDNRLSSMETNRALIRALRLCAEMRVDVCNLSFGEAGFSMESGVFVEEMNALVHDAGVTFLSSAGNAGPALTTVGAPSAAAASIISVGAMVTGDMVVAEYGLTRSAALAQPYTWTSRGPVHDGHCGVHVCAPGAAVTSVPHWNRSRSQLMNGTSMACPNATGCTALLVSAARATGLPSSPARLRRALQATAATLPGVSPLASGAGLVQVPAAWDFLQRTADVAWLDAACDVHFRGGGTATRGIYLREPLMATRTHVDVADVSVRFPGGAQNATKLAMEAKVSLRVEQAWSGALESPHDPKSGYPAATGWVAHAPHAVVTAKSASFEVRVSPQHLPPGVHTCVVAGYDVDAPEAGPVFRTPVTVLRSTPVGADGVFEESGVSLRPGDVRRRFFAVPAGASFVRATVRRLHSRGSDDGSNGGALLVAHLLQCQPHRTYAAANKEYMVRLREGQADSAALRVTEGGTVELALAHWWSGREDDVEVDVRVEFGGLRVAEDTQPREGEPLARRIVLSSLLRRTRVSPSGSFTHVARRVQPLSATVVSLEPSYTDAHGPGAVEAYSRPPMRALRLVYCFEQDKAGTVTPMVPGVQNSLYDSPFSGMLLTVSEPGGRVVSTADCYEADVRLDRPGTYEAVLQLVLCGQHDVSALEKTSLWVKTKLVNKISATFVADRAELLTGKRARGIYLDKGATTAIFLCAPRQPKLPAPYAGGDTLIGSITVCDGDDAAIGKEPFEYPIVHTLSREIPSAKPSPAPAVDAAALRGTAPEGAGAGAAAPAAPAPSAEEVWTAAREKADAALLAALRARVGQRDVFPALRARVEGAGVQATPLRVLDLEHADAVARAGEGAGTGADADADAKLAAVVEAAEAVIAAEDEVAVAAALGTHEAEGADAAKEAKEAAKKAKEAAARLADAYLRKAAAHASQLSHAPGEAALRASFDGARAGVLKWAPKDSSARRLVTAAKHRLDAEPGLALAQLRAELKDAKAPLDAVSIRKASDIGLACSPAGGAAAVASARCALLSELGWSHVLEREIEGEVARLA